MNTTAGGFLKKGRGWKRERRQKKREEVLIEHFDSSKRF